jgi:hypothetical protein
MTQFDEWLAALLAASTLDESMVAYIHTTALSHWVVETRWAWPISEALHFMGLALLIGIISPLDLRLMGFMKSVPISALRSLVPWAVLGFAINLVTGLLFFVGSPEQYVGNTVWWFKVFFLVVAGANMAAFEMTQRSRGLAIGPGENTPAAFKAIGAVSLVSWFMVMYWGRMLPFLGNAF